jgi:hypothetical protein
VVAYLRKGETYADLACGYIREALGLLAAMAPTLDQAIEVASRKAFVILGGTFASDRQDRHGQRSGSWSTPESTVSSAERAGHRRPVRVDLPATARCASMTWAPAASTGSSTRSPRLIPTVAETAYLGAGSRTAIRSGDAASTSTPAAAGDSHATRRRSTPRTPANAGRVNGSTRS